MSGRPRADVSAFRRAASTLAGLGDGLDAVLAADGALDAAAGSLPLLDASPFGALPEIAEVSGPANHSSEPETPRAAPPTAPLAHKTPAEPRSHRGHGDHGEGVKTEAALVAAILSAEAANAGAASPTPASRATQPAWRGAVRAFRGAGAGLGAMPTAIGGLLASDDVLATADAPLPLADASPFDAVSADAVPQPRERGKSGRGADASAKRREWPEPPVAPARRGPVAPEPPRRDLFAAADARSAAAMRDPAPLQPREPRAPHGSDEPAASASASDARPVHRLGRRPAGRAAMARRETRRDAAEPIARPEVARTRGADAAPIARPDAIRARQAAAAEPIAREDATRTREAAGPEPIAREDATRARKAVAAEPITRQGAGRTHEAAELARPASRQGAADPLARLSRSSAAERLDRQGDTERLSRAVWEERGDGSAGGERRTLLADLSDAVLRVARPGDRRVAAPRAAAPEVGAPPSRRSVAVPDAPRRPLAALGDAGERGVAAARLTADAVIASRASSATAPHPPTSGTGGSAAAGASSAAAQTAAVRASGAATHPSAPVAASRAGRAPTVSAAARVGRSLRLVDTLARSILAARTARDNAWAAQLARIAASPSPATAVRTTADAPEPPLAPIGGGWSEAHAEDVAHSAVHVTDPAIAALDAALHAEGGLPAPSPIAPGVARQAVAPHAFGELPLDAGMDAQAPLDAGALASLVNDALVEQALRHGVDLS